MIIIRVAETLRIVQDRFDVVDQRVEELGALGVAEQRSAHRCYLKVDVAIYT